MAHLVGRTYEDYVIDLGDTVEFEHEGDTLRGERYFVDPSEATKIFD